MSGSADRHISSILFACTMNSVRSPMAEGVAKDLYGSRIFIESAGLRKTARDPLALAVLREIGVDFSYEEPHTLDEVSLDGFDIVVTLSRESSVFVAERARTMAITHIAWSIDDPTLAEGSRERKLLAYRAVRDRIRQLMKEQITPLIRRNS